MSKPKANDGMKIWYTKIIVIVPILLLVLQGCMLMHFMDDHHYW